MSIKDKLYFCSMHFKSIVFCVTVVCLNLPVFTQCTSYISSFPYQEGFESNASWTTGGISSDWQWGTPAHPIINSAGGGNKSWCVGGLSGSAYNGSQLSWLMSPCFDFSNVNYPWISFKLFWECEWYYDGLVLQYSLDGGSVWSNVGSFNDTPDCLNENWYNNNSVFWLTGVSPKHGWSGRTGVTSGSCLGGNGSNGWVTASHCINNLAGKPSVRFRFLFGSGSTCNNYDGMAIDDIYIGNAPKNEAQFSYTCQNNTIQIQNTSGLCPTSYEWNFGDPSSGSNNFSSLENPSHQYLIPGNYVVTLITKGSCNEPDTHQLPVKIIYTQATINDASCDISNNGNAFIQVLNDNEVYNYSWNTSPVQTAQQAINLYPGIYQLSITGNNTCPFDTLIEIKTQFEVSGTTQNISCYGYNDGSIQTIVYGGDLPYIFSWNTANSSALINNLSAGNYSVTVQDANGCLDSVDFEIFEPAQFTTQIIYNNDTVCENSIELLQANVLGGTLPYSYSWMNGMHTDPSFLVNIDSTRYYMVAVTDQNGCISHDSIYFHTLSLPTVDFLSTATEGCPTHCVIFSTQSQADTYLWNFGNGQFSSEKNPSEICYSNSGYYSVQLQITDKNGCINSLQKNNYVHVFPTPDTCISFTPQNPTTLNSTVYFRDCGKNVNTDYFWNFNVNELSVSESESPMYTFPGNGTYPIYLMLKNEYGCTSSTSLLLTIEDNHQIFIPNAFTPDNNYLNETFGPTVLGADSIDYMFEIYNRWGEKIFSTNKPNEFWNGRVNNLGDDLKKDIYIWKLQVNSSQNGMKEYTGRVLLMQ